MHCTRCDGSGFLNLHQIEEDDPVHEEGTPEAYERWRKEHPGTDVQICDCCGDGTGWYGEPGMHNEDASARNGWDTPGVPECI